MDTAFSQLSVVRDMPDDEFGNDEDTDDFTDSFQWVFLVFVLIFFNRSLVDLVSIFRHFSGGGWREKSEWGGERHSKTLLKH